MDEKSIKLMKETYDMQKPFYVPSKNDLLDETMRVSILLKLVKYNNQKCCTDILRLLCEEFKKDPICSEDKFFTISSKIYFPYVKNCDGTMLYSDGEFLEKINNLDFYYPIGLYCESINGKEYYYPVMHNLVLQQLEYYGVNVYQFFNDWLGVPLEFSINSLTFAKYLKKASMGVIVSDKKNRVISLTRKK